MLPPFIAVVSVLQFNKFLWFLVRFQHLTMRVHMSCFEQIWCVCGSFIDWLNALSVNLSHLILLKVSNASNTLTSSFHFISQVSVQFPFLFYLFIIWKAVPFWWCTLYEAVQFLTVYQANTNLGLFECDGQRGEEHRRWEARSEEQGRVG